ncbi:glycosyltransferase [Mesorhizobium sp. SP-1A]|uniref:CgeB family protein n=1 Tax=Mesorhizobium sp. SP-1A TaxID=3077840 RepID=UPI0028F740CF|nr:glycosyltransferase [Mesorhizobium sp. SP-1A]
MTARSLDILILGLSLSSSWGNGHATTFRALMRGLHGLGHRLTFLERDVPWYARHRDLKEPGFCDLIFYDKVQDLDTVHADRIRRADVVIVGSFVPDGVAVIATVATLSTGLFCFYDIDTPVTLAKLSCGADEYIARRQLRLFDVYFSFTGGPTLKRLQDEFHARRAEPLYCSVDETRYAPTGEAPCWDLGYLGTYSPDRQPALERLLIEVAQRLPERRFVVAGAQYPATIRWPENIERMDHLPPSQHASFYSRQRFTLNLTRADMVAAGWSPSVRLFEAAACGCPAISDPWRGLEDFFTPGEAIQLATTAEDVCAILTETGEPRRQEITNRARRLVLDRHTGTARAREFLHCLSRVDVAGPCAA